MEASDFFQHPLLAAHKQYEALRAFYVEGKSASEVAQQFGYTLSSFYSLTRDFKRKLQEPNPSQQFFLVSYQGRKPKDPTQTTQQLIIALRKKFLSVPDIKVTLDALNYQVSERCIYNTLEQAGFGRLPRRSRQERLVLTFSASSSCLAFNCANCFSNSSILCFCSNTKSLTLFGVKSHSSWLTKLIICGCSFSMSPKYHIFVPP